MCGLNNWYITSNIYHFLCVENQNPLCQLFWNINYQPQFPSRSALPILAVPYPLIISVYLTVFVSFCSGFLQAEYNSDLHQYFEFLYNQGIGTKSSPLYIAWAGYLEAQGALQHASAVFQRGIQNEAEPKELIEQQYRQCQNI